MRSKEGGGETVKYFQKMYFLHFYISSTIFQKGKFINIYFSTNYKGSTLKTSTFPFNVGCRISLFILYLQQKTTITEK